MANNFLENSLEQNSLVNTIKGLKTSFKTKESPIVNISSLSFKKAKKPLEDKDIEENTNAIINLSSILTNIGSTFKNVCSSFSTSLGTFGETSENASTSLKTLEETSENASTSFKDFVKKTMESGKKIGESIHGTVFKLNDTLDSALKSTISGIEKLLGSGIKRIGNSILGGLKTLNPFKKKENTKSTKNKDNTKSTDKGSSGIFTGIFNFLKKGLNFLKPLINLGKGIFKIFKSLGSMLFKDIVLPLLLSIGSFIVGIGATIGEVIAPFLPIVAGIVTLAAIVKQLYDDWGGKSPDEQLKDRTNPIKNESAKTFKQSQKAKDIEKLSYKDALIKFNDLKNEKGVFQIHTSKFLTEDEKNNKGKYTNYYDLKATAEGRKQEELKLLEKRITESENNYRKQKLFEKKYNLDTKGDIIAKDINTEGFGKLDSLSNNTTVVNNINNITNNSSTSKINNMIPKGNSSLNRKK